MNMREKQRAVKAIVKSIAQQLSLSATIWQWRISTPTNGWENRMAEEQQGKRTRTSRSQRVARMDKEILDVEGVAGARQGTI
jgi:hypothetical protein